MNALKMNALKRFYYRHKFQTACKEIKAQLLGQCYFRIVFDRACQPVLLPSTLHDQSVIKADERDVHLST